MGRGSSKVGGGGSGTGGKNISGQVEQLIKEAMNGNIKVSEEERQDMENSMYGLNTKNLSATDRAKLAIIIPDKANEIKAGEIVQVKMGDVSDYATLARIAAKIGTYPGTWCVQDAIKLLSYWQNHGIPF